MIKKIIIIFILVIFNCNLVSYAKNNDTDKIITPVSQLEKRQIQTKTYNTDDKAQIMKAILNVLQDEDYIIYCANSTLGYIQGSKDFDIADNSTDISKEFGLSKARLNLNGVKVASIDVSINVTEYGQTLKVRTTFKKKIYNTYGNAQFIEDISDDTYYKDFYNKVDKSLFLLKQKI